MFNRIGIAALWFFGLLFVFEGINKNDPYLMALRGTGNILLAVTSIAIAVTLIRRGYLRGQGVAAKLVVLLWCIAPVSMLGAHVVFEVRKRDVLQTEAGKAHALGRHFIVGYSSFDEVAQLAEKGLIAGVYITRRNLSRRSADALKAELAMLQERRRNANLAPLTVAADQEGGIISHLSPALTKLPALATLSGTFAPRGPRRSAEFTAGNSRCSASPPILHRCSTCGRRRNATGSTSTP